MLSRGYRPAGEAKHVAVIKFVKAEYYSGFPCTKGENQEK
jgi:hypothetical protein